MSYWESVIVAVKGDESQVKALEEIVSRKGTSEELQGFDGHLHYLEFLERLGFASVKDTLQMVKQYAAAVEKGEKRQIIEEMKKMARNHILNQYIELAYEGRKDGYMAFEANGVNTYGTLLPDLIEAIKEKFPGLTVLWHRFDEAVFYNCEGDYNGETNDEKGEYFRY